MRGKDGRLYRKRKLKSKVVYEVLIKGKWKSSGESTLERAETWAKKREKEVEGKGIKFKDFARDFYEAESVAMKRKAQRGKKRSAGWHAQSQGRLERYILPYFEDFYLEEITTAIIDEWLINLKSPQGKEISAATKNKVMTCLKGILQEAYSCGYLARHPMESLEIFTVRSKERKIFKEEELELLFPEEEEKLIKIWGTLMWACYFMTLRDTGHRMGEQAVLTWEDLFEENGQYGFTITKSMDWYTKETKQETKTGYSRATLITAGTYKLLMRHKAQHPSDLIFTLDGERGIISDTARKHLKYAAKNAGIDLQGRTPYCFRHTANTQLLLKADPQQVRFLMGHRTEKETANYNHPDKRLLAKKAAAIDLRS